LQRKEKVIEVSKDCQAVVDFNGRKKILKVPVGSLSELQASLCEQLAITSSIVVTVFKEVFQEYVDLEDISFLPEKPKLKVVPHTSVADHSPPVPGPGHVTAPVLVSSPLKKGEDRKVAVDFNGEARALRLPTTSLEDFVKSLCDQLAITTSVTVTFLDPDLDTYVILENIHDLPVEKAKVKVTIQATSWWGWSVESTSWTTKGFETTRYSSLLVKEGTHIHSPAALYQHLLHDQLLPQGLRRLLDSRRPCSTSGEA